MNAEPERMAAEAAAQPAMTAAAVAPIPIRPFQERGVSPEISLISCGSPQHFQRPAPSRLGENTPGLQGIGRAGVARSCRRGVSPACQEIYYVLYLAMRQSLPDGRLSSCRVVLRQVRLGGCDARFIRAMRC